MRIAVIGTGISGLAAAWLLDRRHEVHVFEREPRLGGHTHTVDVSATGASTSGANLPQPRERAGDALGVDTGFIVYNEPTYPNLTRLFEELEVETAASDMSWSLRCEACDLEYAGNPRGLVAQPRNLARPSYLRFLADVLRFNRLGRQLVDDPRAHDVPLGRFLASAGFGHDLRRHYLLPMAAAIWSTGDGQVEDFPLQTLLAFFRNHGLLGITTHHPWRTVIGGAASYVPKLTASFRDRIHAGDGVRSLSRRDGDVRLELVSGATARFDKVVIAAHADEALAMLADPSDDEKMLLGEWEYSRNEVYLHTDTRLLPRAPGAWAAWNYLLDDCRRPGDRVSLSYHMNRLQPLDTAEDYVVTLNPSTPPAARHTLLRTTYEHPMFTRVTVGTQDRLDGLNGRRHTFYAGAYQRYGFHEDGLWSAIRAVRHLGIRWP